MILASAGSGKTYALTNRYVALLARGAPPEKIAALTFTRKAAGEFFDEILRKLARAAAEPDFAHKLAGEIGLVALGPRDFLHMLRSVIEAMPRLRLGTLDGFFVGIARAFPLELGLAGDFELLQEQTALLERQRVLRRILGHAGGLSDPQKQFIEAFKRATFGREEKRLAAKLDGFLDEHHEIYLAAPDEILWGNASRIWPAGNPWLEITEDFDTAVRRLRELLARRPLAEKVRQRWDDFFATVSAVASGNLPAPVEYIVKNGLATWDNLGTEGAEMTVERKKQALSAEEGRALRAVLAHLAGGELTRRLQTTRGIHAVLENYENIHHETVRRAGKLTFSDVQRLLEPEGNARMLTSDEGMAGRIFIDYRLDAEIDHWLLDEFQDTSHGQWTVLRSLIDEAVQDASGSRSIFCVGDVKQAIFAWREGDARLFGEIFRHYNAAAPDSIATEHLVKSYRSGPPLIAMVNAVFGQAATLTQFFPGGAGERWNREWRMHESATPAQDGQAAWLFADEASAAQRTLEIIRELDPLRCGLSCAVLVQTNATAVELAEFLRREGGLPAVAETDLKVCVDNPVGAALLSLLQAAAHPGDTLAQQHVLMTPFRDILSEGLGTPAALTEGILGAIHRRGFAETAADWLRKLESRLDPRDEFSRERSRQFIEAARAFDATGSRDVAEFAAFMKQHALHEPGNGAMIRVLTVHKAKGLGFDVVLLPDLEGRKLEQRRRGLAVQKAPDRAVEWILDLPTAVFREHDPVLMRHVHAAESDAAYEALALLYVAMTRAKRAMYVIAPPPGRSESCNYPQLLARTLGVTGSPVRVGRQIFEGAWMEGNPDWSVELRPPVPPSSGGTIAQWDQSTLVRGLRRPALRPSDRGAGLLDAAALFSLNDSNALNHGKAVHSLLAEVEWSTAGEVVIKEAAWRERGVSEASLQEVTACLRSGELAEVFSPRSRAELWRERAFEVMLEDGWISGAFDRVIVERDDHGRALRATVFDFKTDQSPAAHELATALRYHGRQLNLYRRVAARLAGLDVAAVKCELVLTRIQRRLTVPLTTL
jgi:ATP-dependent helicase/nuclease subunit A